MRNYSALEQELVSNLGIERRPIAITFLDSPPAGVTKFEGTLPSGCSFWRVAAEGRTFYTAAQDHFNCPVGSYTHGFDLPPDRQQQLGDTLGLMASIGYIKMEDIPGVFRLPKAPGVVVYAPLADTPVDPDLVLVAGKPGGLMLLMEAGLRSGTTSSLPLLARPTCMALPAALSSGMVTSSGCVGNRIYTEIGDDQLYSVIPGRDLERVIEETNTIRSANAALTDYHQARRKELTVL